MTKSNIEILKENVTAEFEAFKKEILELPKELIFDKMYEINAKNEIRGYICDCAAKELNDEEIKILAELSELEINVIEELYRYLLFTDAASVMFCSEIAKWVKTYCQV